MKNKFFNFLHNNHTLLFILGLIVFELVVYMIEPLISTNIRLLSMILIVLCSIIYLIYSMRSTKYNTRNLIYLIIIIGVILRTMYIVYTPITTRQHDVEWLDSEGHLKYIYTLYSEGHLPSTNEWQMYHPPFFHSLAAGWLKINDIFNIPLERSLEGIQVLTAIFSSLIMLVVYKITNKLKLNDKYKILINSFVAVYPTFIILAGSINNDCLTIFLQFLILWYLIKWYENDSWKNSIILALITGLCVMTKLSGAIMAIPILYTFIKKFIDYYEHNKKLLLQLVYKIIVFGIISLPIGLWYQVRCYILFGNNAIPAPGDFLYTGNYSIFERFLSISFSQIFGSIFCVIPGDYNIFAYIVKCSIFGEYSYGSANVIHLSMLLINFILIILSLIYIIKYLFDRKNKSFIKNLLLINWIVNIISYYSFNIKYPYLCTMDFRYIVPTVFTGIVLLLDGISKLHNFVIKEIVLWLIYIFIALCFIFICIIP